MFDKSGHASLSPGKKFRRAAFSGSMTGLNGERALIVRRERLKHRRIKSLSLAKSKLVAADGEITSTGEKCRKRKRNGLSTSGKASILRLSSGPLPPLDQLQENDVIIAGTSSFLSLEGARRVRCWLYGSISMIGRRREMEDAVAVEPGFLQRGPNVYDFFGVYDGHGGSRVAHACRTLLHKLVAKHVEEEEGIEYDERKVIDWEKVMSSSFRKMDEEVNKDGSAVAMMGSTAVVAVVGEDKLVVANCGDSRAVLSRDGVAVALSDDHKPDRPDELERIEVSGGKVINWNGQRVLGVLATSRSIGDQYLKPFVISEPEVRVIKRTGKDEFLILACDGLWDVISNEFACQIVRKFFQGRVTISSNEIIDGNYLREVADVGESSENAESRAARAAALLAKLAIARGSKDNISVIVIELKRSGCCNTN